MFSVADYSSHKTFLVQNPALFFCFLPLLVLLRMLVMAVDQWRSTFIKKSVLCRLCDCVCLRTNKTRAH